MGPLFHSHSAPVVLGTWLPQAALLPLPGKMPAMSAALVYRVAGDVLAGIFPACLPALTVCGCPVAITLPTR